MGLATDGAPTLVNNVNGDSSLWLCTNPVIGMVLFDLVACG